MDRRRSSRRRWCLLVIVLLTSACGGDSGGDGETAGRTPTPTDRGATEPAPEQEVVVTAPTIDELLSQGEPLLIAHAGGNHDAPQETLFAYRRAADAGSDVLELDVMLTADDELVVHHDDTVDRLTDGIGAVADLTLDELQRLDAAHWWAPDCTDGTCRDLPGSAYPYRGVRTGDVEPPDGASPDDFGVPTFREVATAFPAHPLDVEIKGEGERALAAVEVLAGELEDLGRVESTVVVSFDSAVVARVRERLPEVATSPGTAEMTQWILASEPLAAHPIVQIPPTFEGLDLVPVVVERAETAGIAVWVWPNDAATQENADFYRRLVAAGVDGVIAASPRAWPG